MNSDKCDIHHQSSSGLVSGILEVRNSLASSGNRDTGQVPVGEEMAQDNKVQFPLQ